MIKKLKKYTIMLCLVGAIAVAPVGSANAKSYHRGDALIAAAVDGAVIGLVGAAVNTVLAPSRTIVIEEPLYMAPVVRRPIAVRARHYYRPVRPPRHVRYHHRHR